MYHRVFLELERRSIDGEVTACIPLPIGVEHAH